MPLHCGTGEDSSKEIKPVSLKGNLPWIFTGMTDAEAEAPVFWLPDTDRQLWCGERLRAGEEGVRGWDGWMASLMHWTWTWANSGRWWGTGRPGVLQSTGLKRVGLCNFTTWLGNQATAMENCLFKNWIPVLGRWSLHFKELNNQVRKSMAFQIVNSVHV